MRLTKQELTSKGTHFFEEKVTFQNDEFKTNPLILEVNGVEAKVKVENVSNLIMVNILLKGNLILKSTRTLRPVPYPLNVEDQIIFTYQEELVDNEDIFLLEEDELDLDKVFYSLIVSSIPLQIIAKEDEEKIEGENWEVITEDEYRSRHQEENSPFASLKDLDLE